MSQFVTDDDVYEPVRLREAEFEGMIPRFWNRLAVDWNIADWKPLLDSPYGRVRPDSIVVNRELTRWYVVEVELASHPQSHYRSQFQALESAYYGRHLLDGVEKALGLDARCLDTLLTRERPEFLCIADQSTQPLTEACRDFGFQLAVLSPYRSRLGVYGVNLARMPREFFAVRRPQRFALAVGEEKWGGRLPATLPANFPRWGQIAVRYQGSIHDLRVTSMGRVRRVFLPESFAAQPGRATLLTGVDPAQGFFELDEGN